MFVKGWHWPAPHPSCLEVSSSPRHLINIWTHYFVLSDTPAVDHIVHCVLARNIAIFIILRVTGSSSCFSLLGRGNGVVPSAVDGIWKVRGCEFHVTWAWTVSDLLGDWYWFWSPGGSTLWIKNSTSWVFTQGKIHVQVTFGKYIVR